MSSACLANAEVLETAAAKPQSAPPALRIGLITDIHYADKPAAINRYYREALGKLREGIEHFNRVEADFAVELGDFIDAADTVEDEMAFLRRVEAEYARFRGDRHYVLGNHCVWTLTKDEFLANCGGKESFYSFDRGPFHFVILDACYRADGEPYHRKNYEWTDTDIPAAEREWLREDLRRADKPTVVFGHQRLDVANHYGVKSGPEVRQILEESKNVLAVFQGHSHENDYREVGGIHYVTLAAVVEGSGTENNAYSVLSLHADGSARVEGFRRQRGYHLNAGL